MTDEKSLLLVDDDEAFRERLARALKARGYAVRTAPDGDTAIRLAQEDSPELALVDLKMPGPSGLDVVRALHKNDATTKIVVLTGFGSVSTVVEAMKLGASDYLQKPIATPAIVAALEGHSEAKREVPEVSLARAEWEHIHRVMHACGGNVSEASRRLGIHRRSLQRKLQKYPPAR